MLRALIALVLPVSVDGTASSLGSSNGIGLGGRYSAVDDSVAADATTIHTHLHLSL